MRTARLQASPCIAAATLVVLTACSATRKEIAPVPTWRTSTPEQQGIDSRPIVEMLEKIRREGSPVHSVLIVRNGALVTEAYLSPFRREDRHIIYSATKSISALLIGLAIHDGLIADETQPVLDLLPGHRARIANLDERKKELQLRHVLTMTSGIDWQDSPYGIREQGDFSRLLASSDPVGYILDKPMIAAPGAQYNYNSGGSHLLAAIVQESSGKTALQYAREALFEPLGIRDVAWARCQGINNGASEMFLRPVDMAKLGCLILNQGRWDGKQVVPADWVRKSIQGLVTSEDKLKEQYGYGWYSKTLGGHTVHSAEGLGGNCIFVIPDLNMVVVFAGGLTGLDMIKPYRYLSNAILPAAKSAVPLPASPEANRSLGQLLRRLQDPEPKAASEIPAIPRRASGRLFQVSDPHNLLGIERLCITLPSKRVARLHVVFSGTGKDADWGVDLVFRTDELQRDRRAIRLDIGLDGGYRRVVIDNPEVGPVAVSASGHWEDDRTLALTVVSGWAVPETWTLSFDDADHISLSIDNLFYKTSVTGQAGESSCNPASAPDSARDADTGR